MPEFAEVVKISADLAHRNFREGYDDAKLELAAKIKRRVALAVDAHGELSDSVYAAVVLATVKDWLTEP